MKTTRTIFLLIGLTALALAAGVAAGVLASRVPASPGAKSPIDRTPLVDELGLSSEQQSKMREIWEGVRGSVHQTFDDAQELQKQRDRAIFALLSDEEKAQFEKISKEYADQFMELTKRRDQIFQEAVNQTKKILTEEQRRKYEEILKTHVGPGGPGISPPPFPPPSTQRSS